MSKERAGYKDEVRVSATCGQFCVFKPFFSFLNSIFTADKDESACVCVGGGGYVD